MPISRVGKANKVSALELTSSLPGPDLIRNGERFQLAVLTSAGMSVSQQEDIWNMFEGNMRALYAGSSFGWDPPTKKAEMFHPLSRFILVERIHEPNLENNANPADANHHILSTSLVAYTMFRFEREEGLNVVYCYELQVNKSAQRYGLGKHLMQCLADIGNKWGMRKVMLTVFRSNQNAELFYKSVGFLIDPTSPGYPDQEREDGCDYTILSKCFS